MRGIAVGSVCSAANKLTILSAKGASDSTLDAIVRKLPKLQDLRLDGAYTTEPLPITPEGISKLAALKLTILDWKNATLTPEQVAAIAKLPVLESLGLVIQA
jgi:hypothetical protein